MLVNVHDEYKSKLPLYVIGANVGHRQEPVDRPGGYPNYQLTLCLAGEGVYIDKSGGEYTIERGDVFFFAPGAPHRYHAKNGEWECSYIVFGGGDMLRFGVGRKPRYQK